MRAVDDEHPGLSTLRKYWPEGGSIHWLGADPMTELRLIAVDPLASISSYAHAWQVAGSLKASSGDRGPLAWGMLIAKIAGGTPILAWAALDAQGPAAYTAALAAHTDTQTAALAPAPDLIWSTTRSYLQRWHSWYVQARNRIDIEFGSNNLHRMEPPIRTTVTPEDADYPALIVYDDVAWPELPEVLGGTVTTLTVTPTSLRITGSPYDLDHYHWLPTGIDHRILYRSAFGTWRPLQLTR